MQQLSRRLSGAFGRRSGGAGEAAGQEDLSNDIVRYRGMSMAALEGVWLGVSSGAAASQVQLVTLRGSKLRGVSSSDGAAVPLDGRTGRVLSRSRGGGKLMVAVPYLRGPVEVKASQTAFKPRAEWSIEDVCEHVVLPDTVAAGGCFFLDLLMPEQLGPLYGGAFVSQARQCGFGALVAALRAHFAGRDANAQFVWLDLFSANQPRVTGADSESAEVLAERYKLLTRGLHAAIERFDERLVFFDSWASPAPLRCMWCVWEIFGAVRGGRDLKVIMGPGQEHAFLVAVASNTMEIQRDLSRFDMRDALCHSPEDRRMINAAVEALPGGFGELNGAVLSELRSWLSRTSITFAQAYEQERGRSVQAGRFYGCAGFVLHGIGDMAGAEALMMRALELLREVNGPQSLDVGACLHNLATVRAESGDLAGAQALFEEALAIARIHKKHKDADVQGTLQMLGVLHHARGDYALALSMLDDALRRATKAGGSKHGNAAQIRVQRAAVISDAGDPVAALKVFREAVPRLLEAGGKTPLAADALVQFARALRKAGALEEAEARAAEALAVRREQLGRHSAPVGEALALQALLRVDAGDAAAALPLAQEALQVLRAAGRSGETPDLLVALALLARGRALSALGRADEAADALVRAAAGFKERLGPRHLSLAEALVALAAHLRDADTARRALGIRSAVLGDSHALTAEARALVDKLEE